MLKKGDKAPEFKLLNQDGEFVSSSNLKGSKVLIWFYPKANTPGCTAEVHGCSVRIASREETSGGNLHQAFSVTHVQDLQKHRSSTRAGIAGNPRSWPEVSIF